MRQVFQSKFIDLALIFLGTVVALNLAMSWEEASKFGDAYLPVGHDSFYHAVRIIDAVKSGNWLVFQFDPLMHAPEGNWVNWPWAYDSFLALIVRAALFVGFDFSVSKLIAYSAMIWLPINIALIVMLTRALGFTVWIKLAVVVAYVLSPLTQGIHGVGVLDHHQAEQAMFLLIAVTWLFWLADLDNKYKAAASGLVLGFAPAIHTSLFLPALCILASFTFIWIRKEMPSLRMVMVFCIGALSGAIIALWPAPIVDGLEFSYHTLSWFHLGVIIAVVAYALTLSSIDFTLHRAGYLLLGVLLIAALGYEFIYTGINYVTGEERLVSKVLESQSFVYEWMSGERSFWNIANYYTGWVWLLPIVFLYSFYVLFSEINRVRISLYVFALFGIIFLSGQFRFHVFGSPFLFFIPLMVINDFLKDRNGYVKMVVPLMAMVLSLPAWSRLEAKPALAMDKDYQLMLHPYAILQSICNKQPGVVLADNNDGHYIRYNTGCAIVSNNFFVDEVAQSKVKQAQTIMDAVAETGTVPEQAEWVKYIFVRVFKENQDNLGGGGKLPSNITILASNKREFNGVHLVWESPVKINVGKKVLPLAKIFVVK